MPETIDKEALIRSFIPEAVLIPLTPEATAAMPAKGSHNGMIPVWKTPFRIGRESRMEIDENGNVTVKERYKHGFITAEVNDIYLFDLGEKFQISREHLRIDKNGEGYFVLDRGSKCGSAVGDTRIGADSLTEQVPLNDGDTVVLGTDHSPYRYRFVVLQERSAE